MGISGVAAIEVSLSGTQYDAIGYAGLAVGVVPAATGAEVEQAAGHVCMIDGARIHVLELDQAALGAAVAEGFPLVRRHVLESLRVPEGSVGHT